MYMILIDLMLNWLKSRIVDIGSVRSRGDMLNYLEWFGMKSLMNEIYNVREFEKVVI